MQLLSVVLGALHFGTVGLGILDRIDSELQPRISKSRSPT